MPREPMWSGMRAPEDSPRNTSGMPRSVATRFMCPILRPLVAPLDAPNTVKSFETIAASRPAILPKPAILPSEGDLSRSAGLAEVAKRPDSMNVPGSTSWSRRSRASRTPAALRLASFSGPPIASAFASRSANSRSMRSARSCNESFMTR